MKYSNLGRLALIVSGMSAGVVSLLQFFAAITRLSLGDTLIALCLIFASALLIEAACTIS
jgi:hypothetical protein